jgi:type IV conjugative transfer system protein TraL
LENERFPQYLHRPYQVLWFETDDMGIISLCFILAIIFGGLFWVGLIVIPFLYMKFKKTYPRGYLRHLMYFMGIIRFKKYPDFFVKEFVE